jgi:hypothetical protein
MARKSINLQELTAVDPQSIISTLAQENASLRLDLLVKQSVIDKMIAVIKELGGDIGDHSHDHSHEDSDTDFK